MPYLNFTKSMNRDHKPLLWAWNLPVKSSKPLILFDRDDTLIQDAGQNNLEKNLEFLPSALQSLKILFDQGYEIGIATNQSSIGKGTSDILTLSKFHLAMDRCIHDYTGSHLSIVAICPHVSEVKCSCRKPKPGLLVEIADFMGKTPKILFGNSKSDLDAANSFGIRGVQITSDNLLSSVYEWLEN